MARKQRNFSTFNLSFLDIMSCGFGAVILVFLIIDHAVDTEAKTVNSDLLSEVNLLNEDISVGEAGLVRLRNTLSEVDLQMVEAQGLASRINDDIESYQAQIASIRGEGFSERSEIDKLQAEIQSLEEELKEIKAASDANSGRNARSFVGDGNRQYLTGLNLGGKRIVILLDSSASMLSDRLVNIIRLRNMGASVQRSAEKWTRALNTLDWLTAQLPANSQYQVIQFNTEAKAVLPATNGKWLDVADRPQLSKISSELRKLIPAGGTSLESAFAAATKLSPQTDNIFLITDGMPTQGSTAPRGNTISGNDRVKLYRQAIRALPRNVPVNIILAPMEGDPMAASEFWQLAQSTGGAFLSPSKDWP